MVRIAQHYGLPDIVKKTNAGSFQYDLFSDLDSEQAAWGKITRKSIQGNKNPTN